MLISEILQKSELLAELHGFLWTEPFVNRGVADHGWSCRDHISAIRSNTWSGVMRPPSR